jgi:hypothetical protein
LAGDPDEARAQAELLLKEHSLSSYYDQVALKGLQLATADAARGVLTGSRIERGRESIASLVEDLDEYDDRNPSPLENNHAVTAPTRTERNLQTQAAAEEPVPTELPSSWRGSAPVMCLAGRGPLDESASLMLAQLLHKHGLGAAVLPYAVGSRAAIGALNGSGVAMVCLSYLELIGSPSHLRYLVRRLRWRLPEVPILVGFWPDETEILKDDRMRAAIGADYYTSSLHDAIEACLDAAYKV